MDLAHFRALVEQTTPRLDASMQELEMVAILRAEPAGHGLASIGMLLGNEIASSFPQGGQSASRLCYELIQQLVFEYAAHGTTVDPYLSMLQFIRHQVGAIEGEGSDDGDWSKSIQAAVDHWSISAPHLRSGNPEIYLDAIWLANAAKRLHSIGRPSAKVPLERHLTAARHHAIVRRIEKLASHLGGVPIAKFLFGELAATYDPDQGRYHFVNRFIPPTMKSTGPRLPANYILQLAAKFPIPIKPADSGIDAWRRFRQLCTDYATTFGVQPSSGMWLMWGTSAKAHPLLVQKLALHDSLYALQQMRAIDLERIGHGLLRGLRKLGAIDAETDDLAQKVLDISANLLKAVKGKQGPLILSIAQIEQVVPALPPEVVRRLVDDRLAHRMRGRRAGANARFEHPAEVPDRALPREVRSGADFATKPLIEVAAGRYLLLDAAACSIGFFEAFHLVLLGIERPSMIGNALDESIVEELSARGLDPKWGTYSTKDGNGECDAVLECEKGVIFFETKKKALTAPARAGLDVDAILDIAQSLVVATTQSGLHELRLREFKTLTLHPSEGVDVELSLGTREILRVALSFSDFGAFQDNTTPATLLEHHTETSFVLSENAPDIKGLRDGLRKINQAADELKEVNRQLFEQAKKPERWLKFRNCSFMSVPQLLLLLDGAVAVDDLWEELRMLRLTVRGSRDLYFELHAHRAMFPSARSREGSAGSPS